MRTDKEHLQWIYDRLWNVHNENKCSDYMHRLETIIEDMPEAPTPPSHEEIMGKWWKDRTLWTRVEIYDSEDGEYMVNGNPHIRSWFTGRESADIPPEE